ncbi:signal peptidase I [Lysobacter sp. CFH 32150]|uniref:signal peptidase I n=1 Tax=Lysobacter sp. CFH 32150 TaxID=2927128 RepID=UPI001FA81392|nr:signal peptidase I [Lysobacter sp. CFH 32150]MCI4567803.1 signal peptidase I [Lysobacter sp. CFH 32150]
MIEAESSDLRMRAKRWLRAELVPMLMLVLLLTAARSSFANHYVVPTGSMEPTLMPGDRVAVDMSAYGVRIPFTNFDVIPRDKPRRGDIAVFDAPDDGTRLIKRVVAVAGDEVELINGRLTVNGHVLHGDEPGVEWLGGRKVTLNLDAGGGPDINGLIVPEDKVLVLGDHRGNSRDGRFFGLVPAHELYGKAVGVYYRREQGLVWKRL